MTCRKIKSLLMTLVDMNVILSADMTSTDDATLSVHVTPTAAVTLSLNVGDRPNRPWTKPPKVITPPSLLPHVSRLGSGPTSRIR